MDEIGEKGKMEAEIDRLRRSCACKSGRVAMGFLSFKRRMTKEDVAAFGRRKGQMSDAIN